MILGAARRAQGAGGRKATPYEFNAKDGEGQTAMAIAKSYDDQRAQKVLAELGAK